MSGWLTTKIPSRTLGLARSIIGLAALIRAVVAIPMLSRLLDPNTLLAPWVEWLPEPNAPLIVALAIIWVGSAAGFAVGWRVPLTGTLLVLSVASALALDQQLYANHLYLMCWLVALLTLADAGAGMSITREDRPVARWPVLLIMVQLSIVYGFSGITKLNEEFLSGGVLAAVLRQGLIAFPDALRTPPVLATVAVATVVVELFVAIFIWRPRFRPAAFALGLGLHVSISLLMSPTSQLIVFSFEMLALYPLFLSVGELRVSATDTCAGCRSLMTRVRRWDALETVDVETGHDDSGHVALDHLGETTMGFAAVTRLYEHLVPHLWIAPILRVPGLSHWGQRRFENRHDRRATSGQRIRSRESP